MPCSTASMPRRRKWQRGCANWRIEFSVALVANVDTVLKRGFFEIVEQNFDAQAPASRRGDDDVVDAPGIIADIDRLAPERLNPAFRLREYQRHALRRHRLVI